MKKLVYTGALPECGFVGPWTKQQYVAKPGEPFEADDKDAEHLLDKWGSTCLEIVKQATVSRKQKVEADASGDVPQDDAKQ